MQFLLKEFAGLQPTNLIKKDFFYRWDHRNLAKVFKRNYLLFSKRTMNSYS